MPSEAVDHRTASEETLIDLCYSSSSPALNNPECGRKVVKISDHAAIKYGYGVTHREAATQELAHRHANVSNIFRVPEVYRFFKSTYRAFEEYSASDELGYLVMEFVPGQCIDAIGPQPTSGPCGTDRCLDQIPLADSHSAWSKSPGTSRWWKTEGLHIRG